MKTIETINSKNFKYVKCPMCEKYPKRRDPGRIRFPKISFRGIRWIAEESILEIQGHCEHCYKEYRIRIVQIRLTGNITVLDPKDRSNVPIEKTVGRGM